MEPDRFDDVQVHFLGEDEEPPRRPAGRRRWVLAAAAAVALAGSGTAGAAGEGTVGSAGEQRPAVSRDADGIPSMREGHECKGGKAGKRHGRERDGAAGTLRY